MTAEILSRLPGLSALVVGDICLDRWCTYDPRESEPSRETGIPRTGVVSTTVSPGAGGTIANNLVALGVGRVAVLGACGNDGFGHELRCALASRGIAGDHLITAPSMQTFTYTKLINGCTGEEDLPRVDYINTAPLDPGAERQILAGLQTLFDTFDVVLVSDQAETRRGGVVTPGMRDLLADLAPNYPDKVCIVDSRARTGEFRKVILKPNRQEAEAACRALFGVVDYPRLRAHVEAPFLMVTHGEDGVVLVTEAGEQCAPARKVGKPVDICGAGDSFNAGAAVALAVTRSPLQAARFGNLVASITIMQKGTGAASPEQLLNAARS
ncbi:MAG TPA: PfkB family carbohydrate kinase [Bryobacteraceae bacterium]|nr:PfkB family carbohydrate kinase [Bryobacteraceae bacterium]